MTDYLLLRLSGPLASWGEIAVGESRHSAVQPSRSALLGLLGAALGIERHDDAAQQALADGYRFAIKLECVGSPLRDYHTVQVGVPPRKFQFRSRRQELAADKVDTILSTREYRCDSLALIAVEALPGAPVDLASLAEALRKPCFTLYLGRKSCPLAAPLAPCLIDAPDAATALAHVTLPPWRQGAVARVLYTEAGQGDHLQTRHDQPIDRARWHFSARPVGVQTVEIRPGQGAAPCS